MSNQIVLSALKSQLDIKTAELKNYEETVYDPEVSRINEQVLEWLKQNVYEHIRSVKALLNILSISSSGSRYNAVSLSIDRHWSKDRQPTMRFSSYSGNFRSGEDNDMLDLIIAGKVAEKFYTIEHEFINTWNPLFETASEPVNKMYSEVGQLEQSIYQIERDLVEEEKNLYKQVGFECKVNSKKEIKNRWNNEQPLAIEDEPHEIKLQFGRSKYEYMYVGYFKVKAINKYKCTLEIQTQHSTDREVTVTMNQYNNFVEEVYRWQTSESQKRNQRELERFEELCEYRKKQNA